MKIDWKTSSESNTLSGILFGVILGSFWTDIGPIFVPKSPIWRPISSEMAPKSIKNQCWKPSKSVFNVFKLFESLKIDFFIDFYWFYFPNVSQNGPPNDPQIHQKSIPRPPGLSEGPPDGPRSLQDSILDWPLMMFVRFWDNSRMIFITILERF